MEVNKQYLKNLTLRIWQG